jgi:hypothetical protein
MVSRQPHASAALPPGKETPVPIVEEAVWAQEPSPAGKGNFGVWAVKPTKYHAKILYNRIRIIFFRIEKFIRSCVHLMLAVQSEK